MSQVLGQDDPLGIWNNGVSLAVWHHSDAINTLIPQVDTFEAFPFTPVCLERNDKIESLPIQTRRVTAEIGYKREQKEVEWR
jgi:hypothetical protein